MNPDPHPNMFFICSKASCRRSHRSANETFAFPAAFKLAVHFSRGNRISALNVPHGHEKIKEMIDGLCIAAAVASVLTLAFGLPPPEGSVQEDECHQSQRKYNMGRRMRKDGALVFAGVVVMEPIDSSGKERISQAFMTCCKNRSAAEVLPLLFFVAPDGTVVRTDAAKIYQGLEGDFDYSCSNHSLGYVCCRFGQRVHSNGVESLFSAVKRLLRVLWGRQSPDSGLVALRYQLALYLWHSPASTRLIAVLELMRFHRMISSFPEYEHIVRFALEWVGCTSGRVFERLCVPSNGEWVDEDSGADE